MIRNLLNYKVYIGQAKHWKKGHMNVSGERTYTRHGYQGRFKEHINHALSQGKQSSYCPKLYNAIRKYGKDYFITHRIGTYSIEQLDEQETRWISIFNATTQGYNVLHGPCCPRSNIPFEERNRRQRPIPKYVYEVKREDEVLGYQAQVPIEGTMYNKTYSSSVYTLEENLDKISRWIRILTTCSTHERELMRAKKIRDLPTSIRYCVSSKNGSILGYRVSLRANNVLYSKTFTDRTKSEEQNLNEAIQWRDTVLSGTIINDNPRDRVMGHGLPKNIHEKRKNGEVIGYSVTITIDGTKYQKSITSKKYSLETKLHQAIEWKQQLIESLSNNS